MGREKETDGEGFTRRRCPNCGCRVVPLASGLCPACRHVVPGWSHPKFRLPLGPRWTHRTACREFVLPETDGSCPRCGTRMETPGEFDPRLEPCPRCGGKLVASPPGGCSPCCGGCLLAGLGALFVAGAAEAYAASNMGRSEAVVPLLVAISCLLVFLVALPLRRAGALAALNGETHSCLECDHLDVDGRKIGRKRAWRRALGFYRRVTWMAGLALALNGALALVAIAGGRSHASANLLFWTLLPAWIAANSYRARLARDLDPPPDDLPP